MSSATPREVGAAVGRRPWIVGLVVLCVGHVVLILSRTYVTGGDWAFIELRTRDVFSSDSPLTGAWSRYGWNHPGPLLYEILALPYLITGSSWRGLWLGALALNVVALVVAVRLLEPGASSPTAVRTAEATARRGRDVDASTHAAWLPAWAIAVAGLWTLAAGTPHLATDPWNASVVVVPVLTMVAATAAALSGDRRGVAVAAVTYVAVAQTHAAYGVLLLPLVLVALGLGLLNWRRYTSTWIGVGSILMIPVLVDTVVNWPGNFYRSIRFTLTAAEPAVGFGQAARVISRATSLTFFGEAQLPSFVATVRDPPWGAVAFAGLLALVVAHRLATVRCWTVQRRALEATALLWLGGGLMVARTRGPLLVWLTTWTVPAAAVTWCLVAATALRWLLDRRPPTIARRAGPRPTRPSALGSIAVAVTTACVATVNVWGSIGEGYAFAELRPVVQQFADDAEILAGAPIAIDLAGDEYVAGAVQSGLIVELEARGAEPRGRPDQRLQIGAHRTDEPLEPPFLLVRVEARSGALAGATIVSVSDPLTEDERDEADALMIELGALLDTAGVGDRRDLLANDLAPIAAFEAPAAVEAELASFERLGDLHARGKRIVLYLVES